MYTIEEFDKAKTKILKYIMYQKRSEKEIINKFSKTIEENLLEDIINYLKEAGYINDKEYINKKIKEFILLKNLSIKEIQYKLLQKGLKKSDIEDWISENIEKLEEYEQKSAQNLVLKKSNIMEVEEIQQFLLKKGYKLDSVKNAIKEIQT